MDKNSKFEYQGQNLEHTCFDGQELSEADFSRANLQGATFKNSVLRNANFSNADIRGCDFSGAVLVGANFENSRSGISADRFTDLLFCSFGFAALMGTTALESGSDVGISIDRSSTTQSVGTLGLAAIFSLAGSGLFLASLYKTWVGLDNIQIGK